MYTQAESSYVLCMGAFDDLKHPQRQRLIYLDQCLTWRGMANRKDLVDRFGISTAQAALDFRLYLERSGKSAPGYDSGEKTYRASKRQPGFAVSSIATAFDILSDDSSASLPIPRRHADPEAVSRLYQAMKAEQAVNLRYTSMRSGADREQWLAPTQFTSDGESVHIRAFSFKHREYRNYLPVRIESDSSFEVRSLSEPLPFDTDWETPVRILLRPKKSLTKEQAQAVRREYGFDGEFLIISTRKPLEFYVDRRWGLNQKGSRLERARTETSSPLSS